MSEQQVGKEDIVRRDSLVSPWQPASGTPDALAPLGGAFLSMEETYGGLPLVRV